jgi:WS/DGAT/MGAT family acyltransferase
MSILDATFLRMETREAPTHVAALQIFRIPEGAGPNFVRDIVTTYRAEGPLTGPFGYTLAKHPFARLNPSLEQAEVDLEYHIRHSSLPAPGGERELGELISHLHGVVLDRSRPLWTCHVIEGLQGNRFAIYTKVHHALTDGVGAMQLVTQALAAQPDGAWSAPWQREDAPTDAAEPQASATAALKTALHAAVPLTWGLVSRKRGSAPDAVCRPFEAPDTAINGPITGARRVATRQLDLARIRSIAKQTDTSINDVFLAISGTALRRHLDDTGVLPTRPLTAGMPVSLRQPGETTANAVGYLWANLATDVDDTRQRLDAIHASTTAAKAHLKSMPAAARKLFTTLTMTPVIAVWVTGLGARVRPPMNLTISNVPGPREPLYLNGARLEAFYPVSIPTQGQALNITCVTYDGKLNIGFTGCRDSLPHLQRLAVYASDALDELEATLAPPSRAKKPSHRFTKAI